MANQIPLSGASSAAGGYVLPTELGGILVNGILRETGALQQCGDSRGTGKRATTFPIWLGKPTAGFVGEGARKPVTGAEFGTGTLNVKKVATIVPMTDEWQEDLEGDEVNALIDDGVRDAIAEVIDAHIIGKAAGVDLTTSFDSMLRSTTSSVELGVSALGDRLRLAISAAMGILEANGYGNPANMGIILAADIAQHIRDARETTETTRAVYADSDPFYGLSRSFSSNLNNLSAATAAGKIVGFVVSKPNLHFRLRKDVTVSVSTEATINDGTSDRFLWQEDMQALRYVTRPGFFVHDINRSVVKLLDAVSN